MINYQLPKNAYSESDLKSCQNALTSFFTRKPSGFFQVTQREGLWAQSADRANQIKNAFDQMVVVGLGGSSLGAKALKDFLSAQYQTNKILFLENVDPYTFDLTLKQLPELERTHWALISK